MMNAIIQRNYLFGIFASLLFILISSQSILADEVPMLPASYYGTITIDGSPTDNIEVNSCIDGETRGSVLAYQGTYGIKDYIRLPAVGNSSDEGEMVYFCIGDMVSNEGIAWISGDVREVNITFDSDSGSGSSSSSSSGGGGGKKTIENAEETSTNESQKTTKQESKISEEVESNQEATFYFDNMDVYEIAAVFASDTSNPAITVETLNVLPESMSRVPENKLVYKYLSIEKNAESGEITQAKIRFRVDATWISNNGLSSEDITLIHYKDGVWQELPTGLIGTQGGFYNFESVTGSLSFFAIAADKKETNPQSDMLILAIVAVLLIIVLAGFFLLKNQKTTIPKKFGPKK